MREPASGLTHLAAGVAATAGLVVLLAAGRGDGAKQASLLVYGLSLVLLFFSSAAYHLVDAGPRWTEVLRKLDHAAIYVLIAGTYTPFCCSCLGEEWRWRALAVVWALAVAGVAAKVFARKAPRWLTAGVYVAMGWLAVLAPREVIVFLPAGALAWLILGGVFYTLGAVVYVTKKMDLVPGVFGFHEVWHVFVILGSLSHYIGVLAYIAPARGAG